MMTWTWPRSTCARSRLGIFHVYLLLINARYANASAISAVPSHFMMAPSKPMHYTRGSLCPLSHPFRTSIERMLNIRGGGDLTPSSPSQPIINSANNNTVFLPPTSDSVRGRYRFPRFKMWETCVIAVVIWMTTGTIFYSRVNKWPLATAFFYAVDAGMSIGFCTDVAEKTKRSRAFSIVFILLGASVVGGALALFMADLLEGVSRTITFEYRTLIENDAFTKNDANQDGYLTFAETKQALREAGYALPEEKLQYICDALDKDNDERISLNEFVGIFRKTDMLLGGVDVLRRRKWIQRILPDSSSLEENKYVMYAVFFGWISMGIIWGMVNQKWDPITSTHFAVSALATGGLTAPPVNDDGFLNTDVAIFVGVFSLLGVPLFYLAMGHSAKLLVQSHLTDAEQRIIRTPLKSYEYSIATKLISTQDDVMHLSDFIVLQFLRRGLTDVNTIKLVKEQFEEMDRDNDGALSFEEATGTCMSGQH
mmetsp:Transcript_35083/g.70931  ORF Transcript_35083/g.70931 Transcript_35083/m.70931 type:complete len:482 (-) Transcript_35083:873-2318(-)